MVNNNRKTLRYFLKDDIRLETDFENTDQNLGVPAPPPEKPPANDAEIIRLPSPQEWPENLGKSPLRKVIGNRRSRRKFSSQPLNINELSFLLWATQGISKKMSGISLRTVPSAGCRHAFETYLAVFNVEKLEEGIYRYLPSDHSLVKESSQENLKAKVTAASLNQSFTANGAVTFIWSVIPYRMEWRYSTASYKVIAMDAGHLCQNLYLACESIEAGTCAVAAYHQKMADRLLELDGEDEFVIYMAPVGKKRSR